MRNVSAEIFRVGLIANRWKIRSGRAIIPCEGFDVSLTPRKLLIFLELHGRHGQSNLDRELVTR